MGKLYDKRDCEFDLAQIDKLEQEVSSQVLAGTFDALKVPLTVALFEKERVRCRMEVLRSGSLVRDLRGALALFRACPHCTTNALGKQRPCGAHAAIVGKAKRAIHYAVEDNQAKRAANGTTRDADETHDGALNEWETWYYADRRNGVWPGDVAYVREQYGSADYRGWLTMLLQEEEIPYAVYHSELVRLRGEL
jgi:hypothetical protein